MSGFLQRLKERKLVQWAIAYVAAGFALLQGIDIIAQRFGWPESIERALIVALAIGFFVTIVLAWYHGERGAQRVSGTELMFLALLLAIGGGALWKFAGAPSGTSAVAGTVTPAGASRNTSSGNSAVVPHKSIAVLPFTALSPTHDQEYFSELAARGKTAEAIKSLAEGLRVLGAGLPAGVPELMAAGIYGDASARAQALAAIQSYLSTRPPTLSGSIPYSLLRMGDYAQALALMTVKARTNGAMFFHIFWSPPGRAVREAPEFKTFVTKAGLTALWDKYGAPDVCRRVALGDYDCGSEVVAKP